MTEKHRTIMKQPSEKGGRVGYHRLVTGIDAEKTNVYAFEGSWIPADTEVDLPVSAIIIRKTPTGSNAHPAATWAYSTVPPQGKPLDWSEEYENRRFLTFRDAVEELHRTINETDPNGAKAADSSAPIHLRESSTGAHEWIAFCKTPITQEESISYHSFRTLGLAIRFFCNDCLTSAANNG